MATTKVYSAPADADIWHVRSYWRTYSRSTPSDNELRRASEGWAHQPVRLIKSAMAAVAQAANGDPFEKLAIRVTAELQRLVEIDRKRREVEARIAQQEGEARLEAERQAQADKEAAELAAEEAALNRPSKTIEEEIRALINEGYRARAKRHHPDHGGTTAGMTMVNLAIERLRRSF